MRAETLPLPAVAVAPAPRLEPLGDAASRWRLLDDPQEWQTFSRRLPSADASQTWESFLALQGLHCPACSLAVERALTPLAGVHEVQVNAATATARVVWQPGRSQPSDWARALAAAGYGALPAGDLPDSQAQRHAQRLLLWQWLVAGFCMMQIMMYAAPAYVAAPGDIPADVQALLRWASWLLTLPVLLFSCRPFFASALRDLRRGRLGMDVPVSLGLVVAFVASSVATFDPAAAGEVWYDSVAMFVFFLLSGRLLQQRLQDRTAGALQALARRLPPQARRRLPDGRFEAIALRQLRVGDVLQVRPGETFVADGTVLEGESSVDEALLTGESRAVARSAAQAVVAGSHNLSGTLLVQVVRVGADTRFADIVALMERAAMQKPRLAQMADRAAGPFLLGVLLAAAVAAAAWWPLGAAHAIGVAVAVLIVTCPCALSLATPAATLASAGALARAGVQVRVLQALEAAARVDTVVFDKTGTLTCEALALVACRSRADVAPAQALALAARLASHSLHPAARALAAACSAPAVGELQAVHEEPGQGLRGTWRTPEGESQPLRLGSAAWCGITQPAAPVTQVHLADAQGWLATFELDESLRPDAALAVAQLRRLGLRLVLLSGDIPAAAHRLAARLALAESRGGQTPEDKRAYVEALRTQGRRVMMVGDGLNDGPVLASAEVSVAMGQAAPLAQARSDFIVLGGQLAAVARLLVQARRTRRVMAQNLAWAVAYNALCVPLAALGWMPPWLAGLGMAASSVVVVLNAARLSRPSALGS